MNRESNSQHAIKEWIEAYGDDLFRWARYKTNDRETAEDLVQETFLAAFASFNTFRGNSKPRTWLFSIMNNKIMDYHRKQYRSLPAGTPRMHGESDDPLSRFFDADGMWKQHANPSNWSDLDEHLLDNPEFNKILNECMNKLPDNWRSAIRLKYIEDKNGKEICQDLDITPSNFWQILHRAKIQLRECLEKKWFT